MVKHDNDGSFRFKAALPMDLRSCELSGKGLADDATVAEVAHPYDAHPNQHHSWHPQLRRQTWSDVSDHGAWFLR
jgi:hypothetical protein